MSASRLLFLLGSFADLSRAEVAKVLPNVELTTVTSQIVAADFVTTPDPVQLMQRLGGTIKIMTEIAQAATSDTQVLTQKIGEILTQTDQHKITFAISESGRDHLEPVDPGQVKNLLQTAGFSARYVESGNLGLSSAVLSHHKVTEINLIYQPDTKNTILATTVAFQDIDDWTRRDRGKPYALHEKGLLPPKIARIMVNLAIGADDVTDKVLLDPFCGSGTILMEALHLGVNQVVGSDLDQEAVAGAKQNLAWYQLTYPKSKPGQWEVLGADAAHINPQTQIDYLVSEPFMGKINFNPAKAAGTFKGLQKLYLGAFKNWTNILQPGAKVIFILPELMLDQHRSLSTADGLLDKLEAIGYTATSGKLAYSRPQAQVIRQIYQFVYQPK